MAIDGFWVLRQFHCFREFFGQKFLLFEHQNYLILLILDVTQSVIYLTKNLKNITVTYYLILLPNLRVWLNITNFKNISNISDWTYYSRILLNEQIVPMCADIRLWCSCMAGSGGAHGLCSEYQHSSLTQSQCCDTVSSYIQSLQHSKSVEGWTKTRPEKTGHGHFLKCWHHIIYTTYFPAISGNQDHYWK